MAPRPLVISAEVVQGPSALPREAGLAVYSSAFCMLGMKEARVMRPDAKTTAKGCEANWEVKESPVESSAPRPATKAICATRPLMRSGAQPPKAMVLMKASFMEGLGGGAGGSGSASSMEDLTTKAERLEARTAALRRRGAPSAALEVRAKVERVMAAILLVGGG